MDWMRQTTHSLFDLGYDESEDELTSANVCVTETPPGTTPSASAMQDHDDSLYYSATNQTVIEAATEVAED